VAISLSLGSWHLSAGKASSAWSVSLRIRMMTACLHRRGRAWRCSSPSIASLDHLLETDRAIRAHSRASDLGRRLQEIPGVGPVVASALVATVPDPQVFKTGRSLSAWLGLVPRQNSSGGKERLGGITKAGDTYLRKMLFVGAMAVIRHAERFGTRKPWLIRLLGRRHPRIAAIALANKIGRIAWALMMSGERYREPAAA
jgi:transposase